jgi:molecular chaperone GrpE (heat shock protein)
VTNKEVDEEVKEQKTVDNEAENTADKEEPEVIEEAEVVEENPLDEKDEEINRLTEALNAEKAKYLKLLAEFGKF